VISLPNPGLRTCAARSCGHIELIPAYGGAAAACVWLALVCGLILVAVDLPLLARIAICVSITTPGIVAIGRVFLLRGPRSARALSWTGATPGFQLRFGNAAAGVPAGLARGSFLLGSNYLLLWLRTERRSLAVFIDGNRQEAGCFRGLCRRLRWPPRVP
jgi:hypothetical protein